MKLTAEQRIEKAHVALMQEKLFCQFSGVFMVGKIEVVDRPMTAMTNGRDVTYGREFVESLADKELNFLIVHEAMHKAYRHLTTWKHLAKDDPRRANRAMDYVINLQILDADPNGSVVMMPRDKDTGEVIGLVDEQYRGLDTKQVYDLLEGCTGGKKGTDGSGGSGGGDNSGGSGKNGHQEGHADGQSECLDEHDWDGAIDMTSEEVEELNEEIDHALREGAILAGKMKGNLSREIDEILHPKVDWKEALRDFIKSHAKGYDESTWRRPNRRYLACDIIMPSTIGFKAERVVTGIDTSGSIGGELIARFMGELKSICDEVTPEIVDLLYWDTRVANHEVYRGAEVSNIVNSTKPRGGGGTMPECVPKYIREKQIKPQCVVMLTDGYFYGDDCGDWSGASVPVLWCVVGNKSFVPTIGQSVLVE
jgi:predicted metal-dependent peptidase